MKLEDLRKKAVKGIKAPKRKRRRRDTPIDPIVPIDVPIRPDDEKTYAVVSKGLMSLSEAGKLTEEQADKFVQLMFDTSVIKEEKEKGK